MNKRPQKICPRFGVFLLTSIFLLLTVYLPIYLYQPVTEYKPFRPRPTPIKKLPRLSSARREPVDIQMVEGWEVNISRITHQYVFPDNVTTIINIKNISSDLFLVVVVCSAPANFEQRSAIRDTWASLADKSTRVTFLLGKNDNLTLQARILEESEIYDDIIQEGFVDSYNNLTIKSVMMLKWILQHSSARFLMKSDDDVYLNLPALSKVLRPVTHRKNILVGFLICKAKPIRNSTDKWYVPHYIFNERYFPNYLSGSGYVMSQDVVPKLYRAALSTPIVHLEDVYITGICALVAGVKPLYHYGFFILRRDLIESCDPTVFTNHKLYPEDLRTAFSYINNCSTPTPNSRARRLTFTPYCRYS